AARATGGVIVMVGATIAPWGCGEWGRAGWGGGWLAGGDDLTRSPTDSAGLGSSPAPGVGQGPHGTVATEHHDVAGGRVVGHRRGGRGGRGGRWMVPGPGRAVPGPGVSGWVAGHVAAEHHDIPGGGVVGHRRRASGGRPGRWMLLGPGRAIPGPGVT